MIELILAGHVVFESATSSSPVKHLERACEAVYLGYPHGPKTSEFVPTGRKAQSQAINLTGSVQGTIHASKDSWTVSTTTPDLSTQWGGAIATNDDAVYDRTGDWLLKFEGSPIKFESTGAGTYQVKATGPVKVTLYEHYYRDHLGYFFWDKPQPLWTKPVMGWCSWMAHLQDVNEQHMLDASHFFSKNLKAYGYDIVQMDDGYQRVPQNDKSGYNTTERIADLWNKPNEKFPMGLDGLAHAIQKDGMTPGIWVGEYLPLSPNVPGYVTDPNGKPHRGPWVNYSVNGFDPKAVDLAYLDTFRGLKEKGWKYIKIDTLRHVIYDSYRKVPEYWKATKQSPEEAFRRILQSAKKVWGKDIYVLACWGTIPELAGIPDGCRIGEDVGPNSQSIAMVAKYVAQFHSLNNVIWHNDPDYMCLRIGPEGSRTWASLLALTGCQLMVSDPMDTYDAERLDILRLVGPTVFSRPKNPAPLKPNPEFAVFHAAKGTEKWTVAGHFALSQGSLSRQISLDFLGLDPHKTYLAFDFWKSQFLGAVTGMAPFHGLGVGDSQVVSFREALSRPQVLGTDRHILQGVVELDKVSWKGGTLSGTFTGGPDREWHLFIHIPKGYTPVLGPGMSVDGEVLRLSFAGGSQPVKWSVKFTR